MILGRLFAFLAERCLSYWFRKNTVFKEENWVQLDNFLGEMAERFKAHAESVFRGNSFVGSNPTLSALVGF